MAAPYLAWIFAETLQHYDIHLPCASAGLYMTIDTGGATVSEVDAAAAAIFEAEVFDL